MKNLSITDKNNQPLFFKKYSQEELENARSAVFDSPTLESAYQRSALQSILASTIEGSKQRKDALNKIGLFKVDINFHTEVKAVISIKIDKIQSK